MTSPATDRFQRWVAAEMPAAPIARFRIAFAAIWLAYDAIDLAVSGTAACFRWYEAPVHPPPRLQFLQLALIACEVALLVGWRVGMVALIAAVVRGIEWYSFLRLNDFQYFYVTALILAATRGTGGVHAPAWAGRRVPAWPRDVLLLQAAWMYLATGVLKLNPSWLSGGQLVVRHQYLAELGWPFPGFYRRWASTPAFDSALAWIAAASEITLALLLVLRPRRALVVPLAMGIHGFAAVSTNVWFFGASCVAQVALLVPSRAEREAAHGEQGAETPGQD